MTIAPTDSDTKQPLKSSAHALRFNQHDFDVYCYNTVRCRVIYDESNVTPSNAEDRPTPPPSSPNYKDEWGEASYMDVRNFPAPAKVSWASLDGVEHEAEVDIGEIFRDERVLSNVPDSEIQQNSLHNDPGIFLEVNDRTINVYMKAFIPTKEERVQGNEYSKFRNDLMLAWSHTF